MHRTLFRKVYFLRVAKTRDIFSSVFPILYYSVFPFSRVIELLCRIYFGEETASFLFLSSLQCYVVKREGKRIKGKYEELKEISPKSKY